MTRTGRNDPCPCGSGKKYKKCCMANEAAPVSSLTWQKMRRTEGELTHTLLKHADKYYGPNAVAEAWDEFSLWNEVPMDPETEPELDSAFLPWFVFNWVPDNAEIVEAEHLPAMPVAMHYLEQKGPQLDSYQQRFITEICSQPYSFFTITDVVPGQRMSLRDLLLGKELTVHERQASATLRKGSILYSRIITLDDTAIMVGCAPIVIPPACINDIIDMRENMEKNIPGFGQGVLQDYDIELRTLYYEFREALLYPSLPQLHNTDGDPLQMTRLSYLLKCSPREALDALASLSLAKTDELEQQGRFNRQGELLSVEFSWLTRGNKRNAGWQNTVMGEIAIKDDQLTIDVNSQQRADAIKRKITRRLGKRAVFRNAMIQSSEKMLEQLANRPPDSNASHAQQQSEDLQALPEVQQKLKEMAAQHWQAWLDTPLPALKDQTPRDAATTQIGRERLEALLQQFEQHNEPAQPFSPDVEALRRSLGMN
ncbi:MAG TPA: DUF2384 domain-containing protein [Gammaproteobacteria bacterium]|nr:DUF2384 domain-containing protein [Gammaproteobacteria bacterium]